MIRKNKVTAEDRRQDEKIAFLEEQLKRAIADHRNLECRVEKEISLFKKDALAKLVDKILPVLDDLERAEAHLKDKGLAMAIQQFRAVLRSEGVEEIRTEGESFNPATMDCVQMEKGPKDRVVATLAKGYYLDGQIIRPAKVKVGDGK